MDENQQFDHDLKYSLVIDTLLSEKLSGQRP